MTQTSAPPRAQVTFSSAASTSAAVPRASRVSHLPPKQSPLTQDAAATAILAKDIPLVVAGSFGNIFSRNSINNALLGLEVPRLIRRLREKFPERQATRRTGWHLSWDVRRSKVTVKESGGESWTESVGSLPPSVQAIIANGGLEKWAKAEIEKAA